MSRNVAGKPTGSSHRLGTGGSAILGAGGFAVRRAGSTILESSARSTCAAVVAFGAPSSGGNESSAWGETTSSHSLRQPVFPLSIESSPGSDDLLGPPVPVQNASISHIFQGCRCCSVQSGSSSHTSPVALTLETLTPRTETLGSHLQGVIVWCYLNFSLKNSTCACVVVNI